MKFEDAVVSYTVFQFKSLCIAQRIEAIKLKNDCRGKSCYPFIEGVIDMNQRSKFLIKKMVNNSVVQECFTNYIKQSEIIDDEDLKQWQHISDMILVNFIDQIWLHYFLFPLIDDIVESVMFEIKLCHTKERMSDLFGRKVVFGRLLRLLKKVQ